MSSSTEEILVAKADAQHARSVLSAHDVGCARTRRPFDMLKELPPEILERILLQYCCGKSLSTLALALASDALYEATVYQTVPRLARYLLRQLGADVDECSSSSSTGGNFCVGCAGAAKWIRSIADGSDDDANGCIDEDKRTVNYLLSANPHPPSRVSDKTKMDHAGRVLADRLRRTRTYRRRKAMRRLSENLAVVDFVRQGMRESAVHGHWEWPAWVGQISLAVAVDATVLRKSAFVVIAVPMQHPSKMPRESLLYYQQHRTPTALFQCVPMNMVPRPPWGRLCGLDRSQEPLLTWMASQLEGLGDNHVAVPDVHGLDTLDVRLLTKRQARKRFELAPSFVQHQTSAWIFQDENEIGEDLAPPLDSSESNPLVCCWPGDVYEDLLFDDRGYIVRMITLMKMRHRR